MEMFVLHHEPISLTRSAGLLQELLSFSFEAKRWLEWLSSTATRKRAARRFQRNIRIGVALRMLPDGPLKHNVVFDSSQLTECVLLKAEIDNLLPAQHHNRWICRRVARKSSILFRKASRAANERTSTNPRTIFRRRHDRSAARLVI